jgi:3',5'-cyclic AMP phosphodiesterase CpdA
MSLLLHLSDTHFGTVQPLVVEALAHLAAQHSPSVVVLSGDITQRARPAQFQAARAFADHLCQHGAPLLAIPGNHDIALFDLWARFAQPYARYSAAFGTDLAPVLATPDWLVLGVKTTRRWRHKNGQVSSEQIERVAQALAAASPQQLRVVVVHQPVAVTRAEDETNLLRGQAEALPIWAAAGADLVLGGHIHLPFVKPVADLPRPLWAVQAGTAVSSRVRRGAPNSVNLLRWNEPSNPRCCRIEQWDFSAQAQAFVQVAVTEVWPGRG